MQLYQHTRNESETTVQTVSTHSAKDQILSYLVETHNMNYISL